MGLPGQVGLDGRTWAGLGGFTWAGGDGRAHVHEAECAARQRLPAAGAAGHLGLGGRAADAVLAEAPALVRQRRAAVRDRLPTEVTADEHLPEQTQRSEVSCTRSTSHRSYS